MRPGARLCRQDNRVSGRIRLITQRRGYGQPGLTAEFELDDTGAVARLVVQPLGIFLPAPPPSAP
jgi:hypothetical protein